MPKGQLGLAPCTVIERSAECGKPVVGNGLCSTHYARLRRHGTTDPIPRKRVPLAERFWAKVLRAEGDACWSWDGTHDSGGYATIRVGSKMAKAHRVAWELVNGPIPPGKLVRHRCDNPGCPRPDHLMLGTQVDNMADMRARGRERKARGEKSGKSKLTDQQVSEIRSRYRPYRVTHKRLAAEYGMSTSQIVRILTGQRL